MITAKTSKTPILIFDEIDAGIGGATADIVGQLLRQLGETTQLFCVTHLPQVASKGHHHFKVDKLIKKDSTHTSFTKLENEARIQEIARMLGGVEITKQTIQHAEEMLA